MLKKILGTIGTRYLIAFLNLMLIFINAKALGVEGVGLVGIILASVNIAVVFNGVLSGNTIVYFMNRYSIHTILFPAYAWPLIGSGLACASMLLFGLFPKEYLTDIYVLSLIAARRIIGLHPFILLLYSRKTRSFILYLRIIHHLRHCFHRQSDITFSLSNQKRK